MVVVPRVGNAARLVRTPTIMQAQRENNAKIEMKADDIKPSANFTHKPSAGNYQFLKSSVDASAYDRLISSTQISDRKFF